MRTEPSFLAEIFIVRSPPPLRAGARHLELTGFALERSQDTSMEPSWRLMADLSRIEALGLEGELPGVTAVVLVRMPAGPPVRLVLAPEPALAAQLEEVYRTGALILPDGQLNAAVFEAATTVAHKELLELREGSSWS